MCGMAAPAVLLTGASGMIGRAVAERFPDEGYRVVPLSRRRPGEPPPDGAWWDPPAGEVALAPAGPLRAVVHLAGAGVANRPWTRARRLVLRSSRVDATRRLCEALAELPGESRPAALIHASGIGYYGDRGDELLTEASSLGSGFLAELARDWEAAAEPARAAGIRVVALRFGMVLSPSGGPLGAMLPIFRFGLGGRLGGGRQYVSWITLPDAVTAIAALIGREDIAGPVNGVAPGALPQRAFARELGRALRRPAILPAPAFALRLALGSLASELLLAGQRVEPTRLLACQFPFRHPELRTALPAIGVV
jgi:uncharacterized protein (TIGR01777 family)